MGGDVSRRGFEKFKTTLTLKKSQTRRNQMGQ